MPDRLRLLILGAHPDDAEYHAVAEHVEVFEACEYGSPLDEAARRRLFGFLPPGDGEA